MQRKYLAAAAGLLVLALTGCFGQTTQTMTTDTPAHSAHVQTAAPAADQPAAEAIAPVLVEIRGTKGEKLGTATLTQFADGLKISVDASGLAPGVHAIHVHEAGVCEAPEFKSAGGHFNPTVKKHGFLTPEGPHVGDLPNIAADSKGKVKAEFVTRLVTLEKGKPNSLLKDGGTALVIHEKGDDYITDPAGNSGNRVACGVIKG